MRRQGWHLKKKLLINWFNFSKRKLKKIFCNLKFRRKRKRKRHCKNNQTRMRQKEKNSRPCLNKKLLKKLMKRNCVS